jgi:hypothetical protein
MVAQTFPTVDFETAKTQAANVIAKMIGGTPLQSKDGKEALLHNPKVSLSMRLSENGDQAGKEVVRLELSGVEVAERLGAVREALEKTLQNLPHLKSRIKFGNDDQEANNTRAVLSELIDKGADIPKDLLKWAGFGHENNEKSGRWKSAQHTTNTKVDAYGVTVEFNLPEHLPDGMTMNGVKENLESRKEAMLTMLAERVAKYKGVKGNKEEEAKIRHGLSELELEVHSTGEQVDGEKTRTGSMFISLRSKNQKKAKELHDKEHPNDPVDANPELEATNVLQTIKPQELSKAMGRVILDGGAANMDVTMAIIGGKDVYRLLEKQLPKLKITNPNDKELAEKIDEVLASTLFADNNSRLMSEKSDHESKSPLSFVAYPGVSGIEDKVVVDIPLPKDEAGKFIRAVAAMDGVPQAAPAVDFSKFASVDNVELVGVHSQIPALHNELQKIAAPLVGKPMEGADMESFAKNIVNLIEQAHQQIVQGKQALRTMSDNAFEQALEVNTAPSPQVTPSSIAVNQAPQLDVSAAHNWAEKLANLSIPQKPSSGFTIGA